MPDSVITVATWPAAVIACMIVAGQVLTLLQAYMKAKADRETAAAALAASREASRNAKAAAVQVEEVRSDLSSTGTATAKKLDQISTENQELLHAGSERDRKIEQIGETTKTVHTLVNSSMSVQLKISALALRQVADLTVGQPRYAGDVAAAEAAEAAYQAHEAKQRMVDAGASV